MNPYVYTATCDICGGPGGATPRTAAAAWDAYSTISHRDPRVCRDYLERLKREIREAANAIAERAS